MAGNRITTSDVAMVTGFSAETIRALMSKEYLGTTIQHKKSGKRGREDYVFSVYKIAEFLKVPVDVVKEKFTELGRTFI